MTLDKKQVEHIAKLGRLALTETEINQYQKDLNAILGYVEQLQELDTTGVEPMIGAIELKNVVREDIVHAVSAEEKSKMLANAPDSEDSFIKVPQMVE